MILTLLEICMYLLVNDEIYKKHLLFTILDLVEIILEVLVFLVVLLIISLLILTVKMRFLLVLQSEHLHWIKI